MNTSLGLCIVLAVLIIYLFATRVERMETINATFYDSLKDRADDYYYDKRGMTLADYALENKMMGSPA